MSSSFPSLALLKKELLGSLRSTPMFLFIGVFCGLMIYFFLSGYPRLFRNDDFQELAFLSINQLKELGQNFSWAAFLLIPGVAASSLAAEKEDGSFEMLLMTLIRPGGIVAAKLVNVLGLYLLALVAVLPILASALFTPGVDQALVARMFLVLAFQAGSLAAIGMFFSTWCRRTLTAIFWSYLTSLIAMGWLFWGLTFVGEVWDLSNLERAMDRLFEVMCVQYLIRDLDQIKDFLPFYSLHGTIMVLGFYFSLVLVRRPLDTPSAPSIKVIDDPTELAARRRRFPFYLIDPQARPRPIPDRLNPALVREVRTRIMNNPATFIRLTVLATAVLVLVNFSYVLIYPTTSYLDEAAIAQMFDILLACVILPAILARSFMAERAQGGLEMLGMTRLTPGQIMWAKLFGGIAAVGPLLIAALISGGSLCFLLEEPHGSILMFAAFLGVFFLMVFLTGTSSLAVAGIFNRPMLATLASYFIVTLVLLGPYLLVLGTRVILIIWGDYRLVLQDRGPFLSPLNLINNYIVNYQGCDSADPWCLEIKSPYGQHTLLLFGILEYFILIWAMIRLAVSRFRIKPRSG